MQHHEALATPDGKCRDCGGRKTCVQCEGAGRYAPYRPTRERRLSASTGHALCPACEGTRECTVCHGTNITDQGRCSACDYGECDECNGTGQVPFEELPPFAVAELFGGPRATLTLEMGNEHAPDDPIGRERISVGTERGVSYEHRRNGVRARSGKLGYAETAAIFVDLVKSGFPQMPKHNIPPGASLMTLTLDVEGKPPQKVSFQSFFAYDQPGYGELLPKLEALATALRKDDVSKLSGWGFEPVS
jgi:hypothetical protein